MKLFKLVAVVLLVLVNLVLAKPSLADPPQYSQNPDYIQITQELNSLVNPQQNQTESENYTPEERQNKIAELQFQKTLLESGLNWGQCTNQTGKTIAVYGADAEDKEDAAKKARKKGTTPTYQNDLYFLAPGQTTEKEWDCDGIYLPGGTTAANANGESQQLASPLAVKILDGTNLVISTNAQSGAIEFNVPPSQILAAGESNWFIPNLSQQFIEARIANAPTLQSATD